MTTEKPVLVASDVHYGATGPDCERAFLDWLEHAGGLASWIIINGDLFDFWFEFRGGVPRGYEPLLDRLRAITGAGVPITLTGGNHDWWGGRFLREEVGLEFVQRAVVREVAGRRTLIAHGDGLGEGDLGYRLVMRPILRSLPFRLAFGALPVPVGERFAARMSRTHSRWDHWDEERARRASAVREWAHAALASDSELALVLVGHTHQPAAEEVAPGRWYVNSGDFITHMSYVEIRSGHPPELCAWRSADPS